MPKSQLVPVESRLAIASLTIAEATAAMWEENPRVITETELLNLRKSIREFGLFIPPVYNQKSQRIVGGHQRIRAAELEGLTEIPVIVVDLSEERELTLNLALNKIEGKWDYALLEKAISELSETDAIDYTGFSETDLVAILSESTDLDQIQSFDAFVERNSDTQSSPLVFFRSPDASFSCLRATYDEFIAGLYKKHGYDDFLIEKYFFNSIGLPERDAAY